MMNRRLIDLSNGSSPPPGFLSQSKQQSSHVQGFAPTPVYSSPMQQMTQVTSVLSSSTPTSIDLLNIPKIVKRNVVPEETMVQPQPPTNHPRSMVTIQPPPPPLVISTASAEQVKSVENADTKVTNDIQHPRNKFSAMYEDMHKNGKLKIFYA